MATVSSCSCPIRISCSWCPKTGDVVLVSAAVDQFKEIAKFKAIDGKTWNHPVLVGDILLIRNGEEMAAFRLPLASR